MTSTLQVQNIQGPTSGANANQILVPTGQTLAAPGHVIQVVQGTYSTRIAITTATYTFTGLTATITPQFATSKILVQIEHAGVLAVSGNTGDINMRLQRNSSDIYNFALGYFYGDSPQHRAGISGCYLDSPSTTSATVYRTMFAVNGGGGTCAVQNDNANTVSTITLQEIKQ